MFMYSTTWNGEIEKNKAVILILDGWDEMQVATKKEEDGDETGAGSKVQSLWKGSIGITITCRTEQAVEKEFVKS